MARYQVGDRAYTIETGIFVREVEVVRVSGGFCTITFPEGTGAIRVRENRLLTTLDDAQKQARKKKSGIS